MPARKHKSKNKLRRPTVEQHQARIDYAVRLLRRRLFPSHVVQGLCRKFKLQSRTAQRVLALAQAAVVQLREGRTGEKEREASIDFYLAVIQSPTASWKERIAAQTRIDRLLGLDKGDASGAVPPAVLEWLERLAAQPPPAPIEE